MVATEPQPSSPSLDTRPVSAALGTEFLNLNLHEEQPPDVAAAIQKAFFDTGFVLVRGQNDLSAEEQQRFASYVGPLTKRIPKGLIPGTEELPSLIGYISNTRPDGFAREGALLMHSDYCFEERLLLGLCLYGEVVSETDGITIFVNAKKAAEQLSDELRARLVGRDVRHVFDLDAVEEGFQKWDVEGKTNFIGRARPALLTHPVTGEEILYVNELMTDRVEGLAREDSDALLRDVYEVLDDPSVRYEHSWQPGDVIIWDNIKLQHGRTNVPAGVSRSLRRMMIDTPA